MHIYIHTNTYIYTSVIYVFLCNTYINIYTHTHTYKGILFSHKKMEILPFAIAWMNLKDTMLSEIR